MKSALAAVIGLLVANIVVGAVEYANSLLYPFPPGFDMNDQAQIAAFVKTLPAGAFVAVWVAWMVGGFAGTFLAQKLSPPGKTIPSIVVMALFSAFCVFNMLMLPHPVPFVAAVIVGVPLATLAGRVLAMRQRV